MPQNPRKPKKTDVDKGWQRKYQPSRYTRTIEKKTTFFIACEGQTEELYFKNFPVKSAEIQAVQLGTSPPNIVKYARKHGVEYDQIWCVFDRDHNPDIVDQDAAFDNAVLAKGVQCAYSNDSFELWFVLHYQHIEQAEHRSRYNEILSDLWGIDYEKEGKKEAFALTIYTKLQQDTRANQRQAIQRAKQLKDEHSDKPPHKQNPVTTVYELVSALNELM